MATNTIREAFNDKQKTVMTACLFVCLFVLWLDESLESNSDNITLFFKNDWHYFRGISLIRVSGHLT